MSAQANITVFDGASPPVSHTLVPVGNKSVKEELIAEWRENLASVPAYAQVTIRSSLKRMASGVYRCSWTVEVPVMETIGGANAAGYTAAPKVAHKVVAQFVQFAHERSTLTERRLTRQILVNLMGNISTSVNAAVNGPAQELTDQLISAS